MTAKWRCQAGSWEKECGLEGRVQSRKRNGGPSRQAEQEWPGKVENGERVGVPGATKTEFQGAERDSQVPLE